jgi:hypothetical protein
MRWKKPPKPAVLTAGSSQRGSGLPSLKRETGDREEKDPLWQQVRIRCENASALSLKKLKTFLIYA